MVACGGEGLDAGAWGLEGWGAAGAGPVLLNGWSTPVLKPWLQKPELYLTNKSVYEWSHGCVLFTMFLTYSKEA